MKDLQFKSRDELKQYIQDHKEKYLGGGQEGVCYLLKDGSVIKLLHEDYFPQFALQFSGITIPTFYFARNGAYVSDMVSAIFMDHATGVVLERQRPDDQSFSILGDQLDVVVSDVKKASDKHILIQDFHPGNMIYDGDRFKIIDTLPFLLLPGSTYQKENIREVMGRFYDFLFDEMKKYPVLDEKHSYHGKLECLEHPKEYLMSVKAYLEELTNQKVDTFSDAHQALQKTFKK